MVSKYLQEWLGEGIIIGNGTHERFYDMRLERDIDVLIVGNYEANKNIDKTIEEARKHGSVWWVGRNAVQYSDKVSRAESVSFADMPRYYNRAKVFLSMSQSEGWGRPVAEAMACGVPKVINENGGNREIEVVPWSKIAKKLIETVC